MNSSQWYLVAIMFYLYYSTNNQVIDLRNKKNLNCCFSSFVKLSLSYLYRAYSLIWGTVQVSLYHSSPYYVRLIRFIFQL